MRKNIANGSDFLPTGLRPLYRIRWQMIIFVNLTCLSLQYTIVCEAVRFRLTVLTVRMTQRYGWEVPGGLVQVNLFPLVVIGEGMQKVVRVHYLPFASNGIENKK